MTERSRDDFNVSSKEALRQIGDRAKSELAHLIDWLGHAQSGAYDPAAICYRVAPSVIARSEIQLFGVSSPRFALRATWPEPDYGFVGIRRLPMLIRHLDRNFTLPDNRNLGMAEDVATEDALERAREYALTSSAIADCLLPVPQCLNDEGYEVLASRVGRLFGHPSDQPFSVYMKHITMGGGLCAQACCFMALALLYPESKVIQGPAEISVAAQDLRTDPRWLPINGLNPLAMCYYFRRGPIHERRRIEWDEQSGAGPRKYGVHDGPSNTGLWASLERASIEIGQEDDSDQLDHIGHPAALLSTCDRWATAVDAYVGSGFPVVFPCDIGMLSEFRHGERCADVPDPECSVFERNNAQQFLERVPSRQDHEDQRHSIIIVGRSSSNSKCQNPLDYEFILHDPFSLPFMKASARELLSACVTGDDEPISRWKTRNWRRNLGGAKLISIKPYPAKLPMLAAVAPGKEYNALCQNRLGQSYELGVLWIYESVYWAAYNPTGSAKYRLCKFSGNPHDMKCLSGLIPDELSDQLVTSLRGLFDGLGLAHRWLWIIPSVKADGSIFDISVWDAEKNILSDTMPIFSQLKLTPTEAGEAREEWMDSVLSNLLVGRIPVSDQSIGEAAFAPNTAWDCELAPSFEPKKIDLSVAGRPKLPGQDACTELKLSAITSFHPGGLDKALEYWPKLIDGLGGEDLGCEAYLFMQSPTDAKLAGYDDPLEASKVPVIDWLARIGGQAELAREVAERLHIKLAKVSGRIKYVALASFLPEIGYPVQTELFRRARDAVVGLARVAIELRQLGHPVDAVEMCGPSRLLGLPSLQQTDAGEELFCYSPPTDELARNMLEAIKSAASKLYETFGGDSRAGVKLAFELEPGPLYYFNRLAKLTDFAYRLDQSSDDSLRTRVGFNVDIGHWMLAGIEPETLYRDAHRDFRVKLCHGHISGFPPGGHIVDTPPLLFHKLDDFAPWVSLIKELWLGDRPRYLSLELEAARGIDDVLAAVRHGQSIIWHSREEKDG